MQLLSLLSLSSTNVFYLLGHSTLQYTTAHHSTPRDTSITPLGRMNWYRQRPWRKVKRIRSHHHLQSSFHTLTLLRYLESSRTPEKLHFLELPSLFNPLHFQASAH
ncbi:hypothetical protein EDB84DRAFT_542169 [Lactarius hengduanensis]|nr:hypothetical protein EDB84DRAFT_542169 [Lactarius hengduanensis]